MQSTDKEIQSKPKRSLISYISFISCIVGISIFALNLNVTWKISENAYLRTILGYTFVVSLLLSLALSIIDVIKTNRNKDLSKITLIISGAVVGLFLLLLIIFTLIQGSDVK